MLAISGLQHFSFCKRQWALIHLEGQWQENLLTTQGQLMHTRVHNQEQSGVYGGVITMRSMPLRSLSLGLFGVADIVEFHPALEAKGASLVGYSGQYIPRPVEYKRGKSKVGDHDRVQLCAQSICLEEMLDCQIEQAEIYYGETRRRERVIIDDTLREKMITLCAEMRQIYNSGQTPPAKASIACKQCSLQNICIPKTSKRSVQKYWSGIMKGVIDEL